MWNSIKTGMKSASSVFLWGSGAFWMFQVQSYYLQVWIISSNPPLIVFFHVISGLPIRAVWGKYWFENANQVLRWKESCLISSAAGSFSGGCVWKQVRLLLPHLENFKSPSEIKTGQNSAQSSAMETRVSSAVGLKPPAVFTVPSSSFVQEEKHQNHRRDLVDLSSALLKLRHVAVMNVYVNIKADVLQREEAETAIYVSRVTSQQRGRRKWSHQHQWGQKIIQTATAKTPNTIHIST